MTADGSASECPHHPEARNCHICGTEKQPLLERYHPSVSGPGGCIVLCTVCLMLPPDDPERVPPIVDEILARKGKR